MGFIVTDGKDFFSDEKTSTHQEINMPEKGIPAYHLFNKCIIKYIAATY
jgi:glucoamylase